MYGETATAQISRRGQRCSGKWAISCAGQTAHTSTETIDKIKKLRSAKGACPAAHPLIVSQQITLRHPIVPTTVTNGSVILVRTFWRSPQLAIQPFTHFPRFRLIHHLPFAHGSWQSNASQLFVSHETTNHGFQRRPRPQLPQNTLAHSAQAFPTG